jgi:hypothetical protein
MMLMWAGARGRTSHGDGGYGGFGGAGMRSGKGGRDGKWRRHGRGKAKRRTADAERGKEEEEEDDDEEDDIEGEGEEAATTDEFEGGALNACMGRLSFAMQVVSAPLHWAAQRIGLTRPGRGRRRSRPPPRREARDSEASAASSVYPSCRPRSGSNDSLTAAGVELAVF